MATHRKQAFAPFEEGDRIISNRQCLRSASRSSMLMFLSVVNITMTNRLLHVQGHIGQY